MLSAVFFGNSEGRSQPTTAKFIGLSQCQITSAAELRESFAGAKQLSVYAGNRNRPGKVP